MPWTQNGVIGFAHDQPPSIHWFSPAFLHVQTEHEPRWEVAMDRGGRVWALARPVVMRSLCHKLHNLHATNRFSQNCTCFYPQIFSFLLRASTKEECCSTRLQNCLHTHCDTSEYWLVCQKCSFTLPKHVPMVLHNCTMPSLISLFHCPCFN